MKKWQLQEAKARFSDLVKKAISQGPQNITVRGKPMVVLLSVRDYKRLTQASTPFVEFLRQSPLLDSELDIERDKSPTRDIDL